MCSWKDVPVGGDWLGLRQRDLNSDLPNSSPNAHVASEPLLQTPVCIARGEFWAPSADSGLGQGLGIFMLNQLTGDSVDHVLRSPGQLDTGQDRANSH